MYTMVSTYLSSMYEVYTLIRVPALYDVIAGEENAMFQPHSQHPFEVIACFLEYQRFPYMTAVYRLHYVTAKSERQPVY